MRTQRKDLAAYVLVAGVGLLLIWWLDLSGYPDLPETMRALGY